MKELIVPKKIRKGDTVAFISISGGRAGDSDMTKYGFPYLNIQISLQEV